MSVTPLYPPDFHVRPFPPPRSKRTSKRCASMPAGVTPIVRFVFAAIAWRGLHYQELADASGATRVSLKMWRKKNRPSWESLQAVVSALGFGFVPTPASQVLPPELADEITALALKAERTIPDVWAALVDIGVEQKLLRMDSAERLAVIDASRAELPTHRYRKSKPANDNDERATDAA